MFTNSSLFPSLCYARKPWIWGCELNPTHCGFQVLLASPSSSSFPHHPQEELHGGLWASSMARVASDGKPRAWRTSLV